MQLYLATIERFADTDPALLDKRRSAEYARAKSNVRRREILAGAGILRYALSDAGYPVSETPLPVEYTAEGKPYLPNGPHVSLSHSGEMIVCIVSSENAGVDIERVSRFENSRVAKKILSDDEYACYQRLETPAKAKYLADRWTAKEAVSKLLGKGLGVCFQTIDTKDYVTKGWTVEKNGEVYSISTARMR